MKPSPRARHCSNHISGDVENLPKVTHEHCDVSCCIRPKDLAHPLSCDCLSKHLHYLKQPGKDLGEAPEPGDQDSGSEGRSCRPLPLPDPLHPARPSPPSAMSQLSPAGLWVPLEGLGPAEEGMEAGGRKVGCLTEGVGCHQLLLGGQQGHSPWATYRRGTGMV